MRQKITTMSKDLHVGEIGENVIMSFLSGLYNVRINDVRNEITSRKSDIDVVISLYGTDYKIEIKTDNYSTTGNLFYETMSSMESKTMGCLEKTDADILMYYYKDTGNCYVLNMKKFRKWVHENKNKFVEKIGPATVWNKGKKSHSYGYLIKLSEIVKDLSKNKDCCMINLSDSSKKNYTSFKNVLKKTKKEAFKCQQKKN